MPTVPFLRLALLPIVPLALLAAASSPVPVYKEFGNWVVACDNVRTCTAHAVPDPGVPNSAVISAQGDTTLWITRDAGPAGRVSLRSESSHPDRPATVAIDGQAVPDVMPWTVTGSADDRTATLAGQPATALLGRMKDGTTLTLSAPGWQSAFSLTGLAAGLLLFDDVQGRLGTATALSRPGPQTADTVPPAAPLPVVHAAPRPPPMPDPKAFAAAVRRAQGAVVKAHDCDLDVADDDDAAPLDAGSAVVFLTCHRYAYQEGSLAFQVPRAAPAQARLLQLPPVPGRPESRSGRDSDLLTGVSYDPAHATLQLYAKGRGATDCGTSVTWTYDGRGFHPSAYMFQDRCGGEAGDWPTLFRTRATR